MAFILLSRLIANPVDKKDEDVGSLVDDVGEEIDGESDVDFDVEDREQDELDLSLNSSDDDETEIRSNPSDESRGGMHNEGVPLHSNVMPILVAAHCY